MSSNIYYYCDREYYLQASKDYYKNNKESILKKSKDKYHSMSPPKKLKLQQYQKNYQKNYREKNEKEQSNFNKNAVLNLWQI